MDDGVKTLDQHLRATCRVRSAAYFDNIYFRSYIIVYTDGLILPRKYIICVQVKSLKRRWGCCSSMC